MQKCNHIFKNKFNGKTFFSTKYKAKFAFRMRGKFISDFGDVFSIILFPKSHLILYNNGLICLSENKEYYAMAKNGITWDGCANETCYF